jgi:sugar/nucleoside kinase (ribokinase family)
VLSEKEARAVARIVVVGSVAQDDVVTLLQPLARGRHLDAAARHLRLGGGGANTAIPLSHAGHHVSLLAPVGADTVAEWLLAKVQEAGIDVSAIARVPGGSTRSLVFVEPGGERTIVNLHRCRETGPPRRLESLDTDAVYVRSRDADLAELLAEATGRSLVVAHVPPLAAGSRPAHVLVGSESDLPPDFLADPWAAGREIAGPTLRLVAVTRGERGAEAFGAAERVSVTAPGTAVVDTTAAGDVSRPGSCTPSSSADRRGRRSRRPSPGRGRRGPPGVPSRETIEGLL